MSAHNETVLKRNREELLSWKPLCSHTPYIPPNQDFYERTYYEAMNARSCCCLGWTYKMRRYMQEVAPGVFLGPLSAARPSNFKVLKDSNVTHIVCIRSPNETFGKPKVPYQFKYLVLEIADKSTESIIPHFNRVRDFINESLLQGGKALVHGTGGISRSAALVIAYVMEEYSLTYKEAHYHLQKHRFCICPNSGFVSQLSEFEPIYQAKWDIHNYNNNTSENIRGSKRTIDDMLVAQCESMEIN